jgi:glutamine synthetase
LTTETPSTATPAPPAGNGNAPTGSSRPAGRPAAGPTGTAEAAAAKAAALRAAGVRYAAISFVDVHGRSKAKVVPIDHLAHTVEGSELYTGAALDGVPQEVNDDEVASVPDLDAGVVIPWQRDMAWFPSDLTLHGAPFPACSRQVLRRATAAAAARGYTFNLGIETEFYVLRQGDDGTLAPLEPSDTLAKPCYDLRTLLRSFPLVDELVTMMNGLGWGVYSFDHEDGNGQFETDFGFTDALATADRITFFRLMVGELARRHGAVATFMPKPFPHLTGSGAHMNMSLAGPDGTNLFADPDDPHGAGLSRLGYQFAAGILRHAAAVCAVVAPTVNSYKRLVRTGNMSGFTWAPVFATLGNNNRTNMLRIPMAGGRIECRAADASLNTYLAAALILAAGLEGIRDDLDPGEPTTENLYLLSDDERAARGIGWLPRTLGEAVAAFRDDPLAAEVFGTEMHTAFARLKQEEWDDYHAHVSDWEVDRYLTFF